MDGTEARRTSTGAAAALRELDWPPSVRLLLLHGSRARGDAAEGSD